MIPSYSNTLKTQGNFTFEAVSNLICAFGKENLKELKKGEHIFYILGGDAKTNRNKKKQKGA